MIEAGTIVAALAGAGAAEAEARMLRRSARLARVDALGMVLRLLLVGGVLAIAAACGHLLATAAGWALGLAVAVAVRWGRWS